MDEEKKENIKKEKKSREIWLSVSESAKIIGVSSKTIRRAIKNKKVKYKIIGNRYSIKTASLINFAKSSPKLKNKFYSHGIGQYLDYAKL